MSKVNYNIRVNVFDKKRLMNSPFVNNVVIKTKNISAGQQLTNNNPWRKARVASIYTRPDVALK